MDKVKTGNKTQNYTTVKTKLNKSNSIQRESWQRHIFQPTTVYSQSTQYSANDWQEAEVGSHSSNISTGLCDLDINLIFLKGNTVVK